MPVSQGCVIDKYANKHINRWINQAKMLVNYFQKFGKGHISMTEHMLGKWIIPDSFQLKVDLWGSDHDTEKEAAQGKGESRKFFLTAATSSGRMYLQKMLPIHL